jgi:hypothetical protein
LPVPESPTRQSGSPLRTQPQVAKVLIIAELMFGLASKSKSVNYMIHGTPWIADLLTLFDFEIARAADEPIEPVTLPGGEQRR